MATVHITERRRRVQIPFLTLLVVAAVAAGFAMGVQALRSTPTAGAVTGPPAPSAFPASVGRVPALAGRVWVSPATGQVIVSETAKRVTRPEPTPVVPSQACMAMDATAYTMYCTSFQGMHVTAPRATWQACEAMDATTYRQLCRRGDGGRWIEGS